MAGCAVLAGILTILAVAERTIPHTRQQGLALVVASAAAALAFLYPPTSLPPVATALIAAALGVAAAAMPSDWRRAAGAPLLLAAVGTVVGIHAWYQKAWGLRALAAAVEHETWRPDREAILTRLAGGRAFAAFSTPAALGGFFALTLPITVSLALSRSGRARALLWGLAAVQTAGLLATMSATATGAMLLASAGYFIARRMRSRAALLAMVAMAGLLVGVVVLRGREVVDWSHENSPWRLRAGNIRIAWEVARDHPWAGVGPGNFGEVFPRYRMAGDNESRFAHSLPLQLLAETGMPLGSLLTVLFLMLFVGPLLRRSRATAVDWHAGANVGLAAFGLQAMADFTGSLPSLLWLAAMLRGLTDASDAEGDAPRRHLADVVTLAGTIAAATVLAASGLAWNARVVAQESLAIGDLSPARDSSRRAVQLAPWDVDARLLRAQVLIASVKPGGRPDDSTGRAATREAEAAVFLSPQRPGARELRARIRTFGADVPGAYADLCEAARLYPLREEYARERDALAEVLPKPPAKAGR
jgi:hypothetical protein